jgi:phosphoenolpyruvate carboxylase
MKRAAEGILKLNDLRAIPFVGGSQLKQNVLGYYDVGSALRQTDEDGNLDSVDTIYRSNDFFKALVDNCEMAMHKSFFPLTRFLSDHEVYGELWRKIFAEYEMTSIICCSFPVRTV